MQRLMHVRLLQLAHKYMDNITIDDRHTSDLDSSCFYASLALQCDPSSLDARRLLAAARLGGGIPFRFGPSDATSTSQSLSDAGFHSHTKGSSSGAYAAIEVLQNGPQDIFMDVECARIYASACATLGRYEEADKTLSWTLEAAKRQPASSPHLNGSQDATDVKAPVMDTSSSYTSTLHGELGFFAMQARRWDEAKRCFAKAREADRWNWKAWVGLCDLGGNDDVMSSFPSSKHTPQHYYVTCLEKALMSHGYNKELTARTVADIRNAGEDYFRQDTPSEMKPVPPMQGTQASVQEPKSSGRDLTTTGTVRPGLRGNVASKRIRTATTAPVADERRHTELGRKVIGPSSKVKASVLGSRPPGTLSASRTNEQQRPVQHAGPGKMNTSEDSQTSPRRSARVNVTSSDETRTTSSMNTSRRPITTRTVARPGDKPAAPRSELAAVQKITPPVYDATQEAVKMASLWKAVDDEVLDLVRTLAKAYQSLRHLRGRQALALLRARGPLHAHDAELVKREASMVSSRESATIQVFGGLEEHHRNSAEVQCLIGRAYHTLGVYHEAEKYFIHAQDLSPVLLHHMDIMSLTLFHLQREVRLSKLASDLAHLDPHSCTTLIATGNAFTLQGEHVQALHCFQRACLCSPNYAYAYTLAGYEALELGNREQGIRYFRQALHVDERHWNAFAGLGQVYLHNDKRQAAVYYYRRALAIHPFNAVLWDIYGRVMLIQNHLTEAEQAFERAIRLDSSSAMSHVKLAEAILRRKSVDETARLQAHAHLLEAVSLAPEEAHVHLVLAKSYIDLGHGAFAVLQETGKGPSDTDGHTGQKHGDVSLANLAYTGSAGPAHFSAQHHQVRAIGHATLPQRYHAEIARHLCIAIDLNPRLGRFVKAMGEGARAALRGAAAGMMGDLGDASTSMLVDASGISGTQSMIEVDGDPVFEDADVDTEDLGSEGMSEEGITGPDDNTHPSLDQHEDALQRARLRADQIVQEAVSGSQSASTSLHDSLEVDQDVSMSF